MKRRRKPTKDYVAAIKASGLSMYDEIEIGDPDFWIPAPDLESILKTGLVGFSVEGLPNRTRSKVVKTETCKILGYPVPKTFKKVQPRFSGQMFDTYVQKANNLQIWNEELSPYRRYVLVSVSSDCIIDDVRVVTGEALALLDTTGTLTQKYQARYTQPLTPVELVSPLDSTNLLALLATDKRGVDLHAKSPTDPPVFGEVLTIASAFSRLASLVGQVFRDSGHDQERNRGAELHRLACRALGFTEYKDDGNFPDIRNQLIEVKLQTAPTIDLGVVLPCSTGPLDLSIIEGTRVRHCDVRYAVFGAETDGEKVLITSLVLTTGEDFLRRFPQFQGKVLNKKLQIRLPSNFFRDPK